MISCDAEEERSTTERNHAEHTRSRKEGRTGEGATGIPPPISVAEGWQTKQMDRLWLVEDQSIGWPKWDKVRVVGLHDHVLHS